MGNYSDIQGREYALVSEVKEGDILIADAGFVSMEENCNLVHEGGYTFCIKPWTELVVMKEHIKPRYTGDKLLYVNCACGHHSLDGQIEKRGLYKEFYMGFYPKETFVK